MNRLSDTDLLLVGKTGNGKSATGNSILRRRVFKTKASTSSETTGVAHEVTDFNGRIIKVVDCPGVGDTRMNSEEGVKMAMEAMETVIAASPRGYHAFLIVVRFGGRFTTEDVEAIALLKKIFGDSFAKSNCILVLTFGDNFDVVSEETGQSFQEWCGAQEGTFKTLLEECDNRTILFDNITRDDTKRCDQLTRLLEMVDSLRFQGCRYTDDNFARAKEARERAMIEAKVPMIREDTEQETSLIMQKIEELKSQQDLTVKMEILEQLKIRAEILHKKIRSEDKGTGALREFVETVRAAQRFVDDDIKLCVALIKEREDNKIKQEKWQAMLKHEVEQQRLKNDENAKMQQEYKKMVQNQLDQQKQKYDELEKKQQEMVNQQQKRYNALEAKYQHLQQKNQKKLNCSIS